MKLQPEIQQLRLPCLQHFCFVHAIINIINSDSCVRRRVCPLWRWTHNDKAVCCEWSVQWCESVIKLNHVTDDQTANCSYNYSSNSWVQHLNEHLKAALIEQCVLWIVIGFQIFRKDLRLETECVPCYEVMSRCQTWIHLFSISLNFTTTHWCNKDNTNTNSFCPSKYILALMFTFTNTLLINFMYSLKYISKYS